MNFVALQSFRLRPYLLAQGLSAAQHCPALHDTNRNPPERETFVLYRISRTPRTPQSTEAARRSRFRHVACCVALAAITASALGGAAWAANPQASHPLVGRWKIASINGAPPPQFLSRQIMVVQADGQVLHIELAAADGKKAPESAVQSALRNALTRGTWHADKTRLVVSNSKLGEAGSAFVIAQQGKVLTLNPDPYLSNADVPSQATYERLP